MFGSGKCEWCGVEFHKKGNTQIFCGIKCLEDDAAQNHAEKAKEIKPSDAHQAESSVIVRRYIKQLRDNGIYDETAIQLHVTGFMIGFKYGVGSCEEK